MSTERKLSTESEEEEFDMLSRMKLGDRILIRKTYHGEILIIYSEEGYNAVEYNFNCACEIQSDKTFKEDELPLLFETINTWV